MKFNRSVFTSAAAAVLAVAALGVTSAAHANGVAWSVGIASPGVSVGFTNAPPVYVQPAPVYVQPQPVYMHPRPVYYQQPAPVYVAPPVYVRPAPVYYGPGYWRHGHGYGHWHR